MELILISIIIYLIFREVLWYKEKSQMLDRLMSRDLSQFKDNSSVEPNQLDTKVKYDLLENHREDVEKWLQK